MSTDFQNPRASARGAVKLFEFADGSALHRREGKTMWQEGAWSADDEGED